MAQETKSQLAGQQLTRNRSNNSLAASYTQPSTLNKQNLALLQKNMNMNTEAMNEQDFDNALKELGLNGVE